VIFGIALLVFGPKKLPELGKGIGEGIRGFKSAMKAEDEKWVSTITTIAHGPRSNRDYDCGSLFRRSKRRGPAHVRFADGWGFFVGQGTARFRNIKITGL